MKVAPLCILVPSRAKIEGLPFFLKDSSDYSVFFYLKLTDRAVAFNILRSLRTGGSGVLWGLNSGHQKALYRNEAGPWSFPDPSQRRSPLVFTNADELLINLKRLSKLTPAHQTHTTIALNVVFHARRRPLYNKPESRVQQQKPCVMNCLMRVLKRQWVFLMGR